MKTVLVCGSRDWKDWPKLKARLDQFTETVHIVEGGAPGADVMARQYAIGRKIPYTEVPADWKTYGKSAGPIRNRVMLEMLDAGEDLVLAFHEDFENSKGTKDCVTEARRRGIPTEVIS